jgi:alpha-L-fucosidase
MAGLLLVNYCAPVQSQDRATTLQWFTDAKFGLFIHWGLYSQTAGFWKGIPARAEAHFMLYERIPLKEYAKIADNFNPVNYDAEQWVKMAKYAGMKYLVYTAKHHEGFAMYDSQCSDYNIVHRTPFKRDPLKELADACKKEGLKLGVYYSLGRDWEDPDVPTKNAWRSNIWDFPQEDRKNLQAYMERKVYPQLRELLTNYGEIAILWFDTQELTTKEQSETIKKLIHDLQPNCIINDRIGNDLGDFSTKERQLADDINAQPWELCHTMGNTWGYTVQDVNYKKPETLIRHIADAASKGGNFLLNVGPTGKGDFPIFTFPIIESFHVWMAENGEAIYGARPWRIFGEDYANIASTEKIDTEFQDIDYEGTPKESMPDFRFTAKGNNLYIIARGVKNRKYLVASVKPTDKIQQISLLGNSQKVEWKQTAQGLEITVPKLSPDRIPVYVLKATLK